MKILFKTFAAGIAGLFVIGASTAFANERTSSRSEYGAESRPAICTIDHDHRSHAANYYNYYPADKYFRAGKYQRSGVSFSITVGDNRRNRYDRYNRNNGYDQRGGRGQYDQRGGRGQYDQRGGRGQYDRRGKKDYGRRNGYRGREGRVVNRRVFETRYRARIVLVEEVTRTHNGPRLVCTVKARGPEAGYVSKRRMRRIANRSCSSDARIQVYA